MPQYLYRCTNCGAEAYITHGVNADLLPTCNSCYRVMRKVPQVVSVVWNGNKPSDGGVTPLVEHMIADAPRQRDVLQMKKELSDGDS